MTGNKDTVQILVIELARRLAADCQTFKVAIALSLRDGIWKRDAAYLLRAYPDWESKSGKVSLEEASPNYLPERFNLTRRPPPQSGQTADAARFPAGLLRELTIALPRLLCMAREKYQEKEAENRKAIETARDALKG